MAIPFRLPIGSRGAAGAASLVIWAMAAGSAVYWGLQLGNPAQAPTQVAASGYSASVDVRQVSRLLGHSDAAPPVSTVAQSGRYDLLGVVRQGAQSGAAIISVDGRPPRIYVVGREVGEAGSAVKLQSVGPRSVVLSAGRGEAMTLSMKPLDTPSQGGGAGQQPVQPPAAGVEAGAPSSTASLMQSQQQLARVQDLQSLKPGVMRVAPPDEREFSTTTTSIFRQPTTAAVSNAAVFGSAP